MSDKTDPLLAAPLRATEDSVTVSFSADERAYPRTGRELIVTAGGRSERCGFDALERSRDASAAVALVVNLLAEAAG